MAKAGKIQLVKYAPPPPELPEYGKVKPEDVSFIGRTNYVAALEEKKYIFGIKRVDRKRHTYIIGKSGVGKTKILELMVRQDIAYGYGVCVIDPDGVLVDSLLNFIPENRIQDVCVIDPTDVNFPVLFNPLAHVDPLFKHQFTQAFVEVLQKQLHSNWTPRLEHIFRFTILALLDYPGAHLHGVLLMLQDESYRREVIPYITDDMVKRFWMIEFPEWIQKPESDTLVPLVTKLSQFLSDPLLKNIFNQTENKVDFSQLIHDQKIILIDLVRSKIGEENASLLGSLFVTKIKEAGASRMHIEKEIRPDFFIYIDEFQNVVNDTFENMCVESRKYGLTLTIAHQYLGQLPIKVQQTILSNVGTIIAFRLSGEDAVRLKNEFTPVFETKDLMNLSVGEFYIKMIIDGESAEPFSAETLKVLTPTHESLSAMVLQASRNTFARNVSS